MKITYIEGYKSGQEYQDFMCFEDEWIERRKKSNKRKEEWLKNHPKYKKIPWWIKIKEEIIL